MLSLSSLSLRDKYINWLIVDFLIKEIIVASATVTSTAKVTAKATVPAIEMTVAMGDGRSDGNSVSDGRWQ